MDIQLRFLFIHRINPLTGNLNSFFTLLFQHTVRIYVVWFRLRAATPCLAKSDLNAQKAVSSFSSQQDPTKVA